jgi:hypothetical protein
MPSPIVLTAQTTPTGLGPQVWQASIEDTVFDKMVAAPNIRQLEKPDNGLVIRKVARPTGSGGYLSNTLAINAVGTGITYDHGADTTIQLSPIGIYSAANFNRNTIAQMDFSPVAPFRQAAESSVAEATDQYILSLANALTTANYGSYASPFDALAFRFAISALRVNARSLAEPGEAETHAVIDGTQIQFVAAIPEVTHAHILGVGNGPQRTGILVENLGVKLHYSNVVNKTGAGADNPFFLPSAFGIGYNERPNPLFQQLELQERVIVYTNFAYGTIHDVRALNWKSTKSLT